MLRSSYYHVPTSLDVFVYTTVVPADHSLRLVAQYLDFAPLRDLLTPCYHPDHGRPAEDPIWLFKLGFLQFHYNLSDREVCAQTQVTLACRWFLDLSLASPLPDPTTLCVLRTRLGADRYAELFAAVVAQARAACLVKDRLCLTDATHIRANIAIPRTIELVAQTRERLLTALQPFDPAAVLAAETESVAVRLRTHGHADAVRLVARVQHLQELLAYSRTILTPWVETPLPTWSAAQLRLQAAITRTARILADRSNPDAPGKIRSIVDPEAHTGNHGGFYVGYLRDILGDADSGLITNLDLLVTHGDETASATEMITHEEQTHGNDVAALSIDGAGWRGDRLREWQDPAGLDLAVFVPASPPDGSPYFMPEAFTEDAATETLTCPAGQTTQTRVRHRQNGWRYTRGPCAPAANDPTWRAGAPGSVTDPRHTERSRAMGKMIAIMSMSLDGYVADPTEGVGEVFDWYFHSGTVAVPAGGAAPMTFHVSEPSAAHLRALWSELGAVLTGRRTFDKAQGWGGRHAWGPAFVLTHAVPAGWPHPESTVHFVTDGLASAVRQAQAAAGGQAVGVHGADTIGQLLAAGLLDELSIDLVPVLLGAGVPIFAPHAGTPAVLGTPTVRAGVGVTHLRYPVHKAEAAHTVG